MRGQTKGIGALVTEALKNYLRDTPHHDALSLTEYKWFNDNFRRVHNNTLSISIAEQLLHTIVKHPQPSLQASKLR
jgi:hypothetical protein